MKTWIALCLISFLVCGSAFATQETFCNAARRIPQPPSHSNVADCGREMISYTNWLDEEQRTAKGHGEKSLGCQRLSDNYDKISNGMIEAQNFCAGNKTRVDANIKNSLSKNVNLESGYNDLMKGVPASFDREITACLDRLYPVRDMLNASLDRLVNEVRGLESGMKRADSAKAEIAKISNAGLKSSCEKYMLKDVSTYREAYGFYRPVLQLFKDKKEAIVTEILKFEDERKKAREMQKSLKGP